MLIVGLLLALPLTQADFPAKAVAITDGDTIKALGGPNTQHKIRVAGIGCPRA